MLIKKTLMHQCTLDVSLKCHSKISSLGKFTVFLNAFLVYWPKRFTTLVTFTHSLLKNKQTNKQTKTKVHRPAPNQHQNTTNAGLAGDWSAGFTHTTIHWWQRLPCSCQQLSQGSSSACSPSSPRSWPDLCGQMLTFDVTWQFGMAVVFLEF